MIRCFLLWLLAAALASAQQWGGELRFCHRADPKTYDPALVADEASETLRYLTGGVLLRVNRRSQRFEPELAESWKVSDQERRISFRLRSGVVFSDGTPFDSADVAYTFRRLMDPALKSPTGDAFRSAGEGSVAIETPNPREISLRFPAPVAGLERLFDQVAIVSSRGRPLDKAVLGPFVMAEHKPGSFVLLRRNPNYWKRDPSGKRRLPYLDAVRIDIQQNREIELARFGRGELHLIHSLDAEMFERLRKSDSAAALDAGPSYEPEMLWFNQSSSPLLPDYKRAWFRSTEFRRAISESIRRDDICRLVYRGLARPGIGPAPAANALWFNQRLKPQAYDGPSALARLRKSGFVLQNGALKDAAGNAVEFSIITNAGNRARARIAALLQQDLAALGIKVNVVPLDFPSLIERITKTLNYESCLLGLVNIDPDPNGQMNVWLSSSANHQWNPSQKTPATAWEAEIDRLMRQQASGVEFAKRKQAFDRVQEIAVAQLPFLYLVEKNYLAALSPKLKNVQAAALRPQILWNVEHLYLDAK